MLSLEQDGLVPQPQPDSEASLEGPGPPEEVLERLAQTEQLVVQLKELIREKDSRLASTEKQLKVWACIMWKKQVALTKPWTLTGLKLGFGFATVFVLIQEEKEQAEVKFTKLKLQAKAKMASLNKQITELKGQEALNSSQVMLTRLCYFKHEVDLDTFFVVFQFITYII